MSDEVDRIAAIGDPFELLRQATARMSAAQQEVTELSRLRRRVIQELHDSGMSYADIAQRVGLTRGRIHQIRQAAPAPEGAFFGSGPVTVAVPLREVPGRPLPVISSEDSRAAERLTKLLTDYGLQVEQFRIPTDGNWMPTGNPIAICGPKSSHVTAEAIKSDPYLTFEPNESGKWTIRERDGSRTYESPMDEANAQWSDVAYVGRLALPNQGTILVIAGVHALGSVGAVDFLTRNLSDLYAQVDTRRFSMVIGSDHDGETVTRSELLCPPRVHD